jgi:hypothetical protein
VYKLNLTTAVPATTAPPSTLDGLLGKLEMTDEEQRFWRERAAFLNANHGASE